MRRAVGKVNHFFRMTDSPGAALLLMASIRARGGVSQPKRLGHVRILTLDGPCKASVADAHELSISFLQYSCAPMRLKSLFKPSILRQNTFDFEKFTRTEASS
jgi:hypothetical protein